MPPDTERVLVAVGGNAIHPGEDVGTAEQQAEFAKRCGKSILPLLQRPSELIITHGNGPVVGKMLMRQVFEHAGRATGRRPASPIVRVVSPIC